MHAIEIHDRTGLCRRTLLRDGRGCSLAQVSCPHQSRNPRPLRESRDGARGRRSDHRTGRSDRRRNHLERPRHTEVARSRFSTDLRIPSRSKSSLSGCTFFFLHPPQLAPPRSFFPSKRQIFHLRRARVSLPFGGAHNSNNYRRRSTSGHSRSKTPNISAPAAGVIFGFALRPRGERREREKSIQIIHSRPPAPAPALPLPRRGDSAPHRPRPTGT